MSLTLPLPDDRTRMESKSSRACDNSSLDVPTIGTDIGYSRATPHPTGDGRRQSGMAFILYQGPTVHTLGEHLRGDCPLPWLYMAVGPSSTCILHCFLTFFSVLLSLGKWEVWLLSELLPPSTLLDHEVDLYYAQTRACLICTCPRWLPSSSYLLPFSSHSLPLLSHLPTSPHISPFIIRYSYLHVH